MCLRCDGYSDEEIARNLELTILVHGWAVRGIAPPDPPNPAGGWATTIGATENYDLPELIITDTNFTDAHHVLNWAVQFLRDGGTLDGLVDDQVLWVPVHDAHLDSPLFADYHSRYGGAPSSGGVLQLFPSSRWHSAACVMASSINLSDPTPHPEVW